MNERSGNDCGAQTLSPAVWSDGEAAEMCSALDHTLSDEQRFNEAARDRNVILNSQYRSSAGARNPTRQ
jgi:hypothetical protein